MIEFRGLRLTRGGFELKRVSCAFAEGGLTCILGENGSGKTTLLKCLTGLVKYEGTILADGADLKQLSARDRARLIALLPQEDPSSKLTLDEFMVLSRIPYTGILGNLTQKDRDSINFAISALGLENFRSRRLDTLSGGEKRRASLAAALAQDTKYILLDEPSSSLDVRAAKEVRALTRRLITEFGKTVVTVTHDLTSAATDADEMLILEQGALTFCGKRSECLEGKYIERTFGVRRVDADGETVFI